MANTNWKRQSIIKDHINIELRITSTSIHFKMSLVTVFNKHFFLFYFFCFPKSRSVHAIIINNEHNVEIKKLVPIIMKHPSKTLRHNIMPPLPINNFSKQLDDNHPNRFHSEVDTELEVSYRTNITTFNSNMAVTNDAMSNHLQQRRSLQDFCVNDETEVLTSIANAPNFSSSTTRIDICVPSINMNASIPFIFYPGIGIQFKNLEIRCNATTPSCVLNAQDWSRHFYVRDSYVIFRNIIFQSGNSLIKAGIFSQKGGALLLNNSTVLFDSCQFKNNIGSEGGAIRVESSDVTFLGGTVTHPTLFENNLGTIGGGAISGAISGAGFIPTITAVNGSFVFRNNSVTTREVSLIEAFVSEGQYIQRLTWLRLLIELL
jgi:hypothetical protein